MTWRAPIASVLLLAAAAGVAARTPQPVIEKARAGTVCVAEPAVMRRDHPTMLKHQRDATVHGGIRGAKELERRVDGEGWALALHLFPTRVEQVMSVSDAGKIMPPKSTWFEPKLRSGLFVHPF